MFGRFGSSERSFMNLRSCARRMPLVLRLTIFTPFSAAMRMKPRISGWMVGSPPENTTTSGSPSEATNASRPASTWSIVSEKPSGWCPESAKQIGQSRVAVRVHLDDPEARVLLVLGAQAAVERAAVLDLRLRL